VTRLAPRDVRGAPAIPEGAAAAPSRPTAPEAAPPAGAGGDLKALAARMSLQVLTWAPDPRDRFVFLNGRRYGEGQLVDDKFLVERINEDGVVLSYRGERVTLKGR
jgi:general secretion pathway protein B